MKPSDKATMYVRLTRKIQTMREDLEDMRDIVTDEGDDGELDYSVSIEALRRLEVSMRTDAMGWLEVLGRQPPLF